MGSPNYVIWFLLFAVLIGCIIWHVRENRSLAQRWEKELDALTRSVIVRFAWSRSVQLFSVLICCTLIIILYDGQLGETRQNVATLTTSLANAQAAQAAAEAAAAKAAATPPPAPVETPAKPVDLFVQDSPVQESSHENTPTIEDVYAPEKRSKDAQSTIDNIKRRYEDILVIYMFLKKCNRVQPTDYNTIIAALSQEMAASNAPGRLQFDVLTSAKGSYKEIYSRSSCKDAATDSLFEQYNTYLRALSSNFPPPV